MKLEFLTLASPTPAFFSQIAMFRRSLNALGGHYRRARVVAVMACRSQHEVPELWRRRMGEVEIAIPPAEELAMHPQGHAFHRFRLFSEDADVSFLCDADTIFLRRFEGLLWRMKMRPAIAGVMAHFHMPGRKKTTIVSDELAKEEWDEISSAVIGRTIPRPYLYTLHPQDAPAYAPFYPNFGLVAGTPRIFSKFLDYSDVGLKAYELVGSYFTGQVAFALICAKMGVRTRALPMRFNFPNDEVADTIYPKELKNIIMLHYLRKKLFDRQKIFCDPLEFERFMGMQLRGSNAIFQDRVRLLTGGRYPFSDAPD